MRNRTGYGLIAGAVIALVLVTGRGVAEDPRLEVIPGPETIHPGQAWQARLEVSWNGEPGAFMVMPAEIEPVPWGTVKLESVISYVREGRNVVAQVITVVPDQEGDYTLSGVTIAYKSPDTLPSGEPGGEPAPPTGPESYPQLRAEPLTLRVTPDRTPHWVFAGVGALLVLIGVYLLTRWRARRKRGVSGVPAGTGPGALARQALKAARDRKVQGDWYGYYQELCRAADAVPGVPGALRDRLRVRAQDVGYRNTIPGPDELDGDLKDVEQACRIAESEPAGGGKSA